MVEEGFEYEDLGLRGFDFNIFDEERERYVGDDVKYFPCLFMIMKLWPGYLEYQLGRMKNKLDEENGRGGTQKNRKIGKLWRFSRN